MWIFIEHENTCINADHVSRLYVETTGSGAALKAELSGKQMMLGYFENKDAARLALADLVAKREAGAAVVRLGR